MTVDPKSVVFFVPPALSPFKQDLFDRVAKHVKTAGGSVIRHKFADLWEVPADQIPIVGCSYELRHIIKDWITTKRKFIYWDRGYMRRVFAAWLPRGTDGGYYRWHAGQYQMGRVDLAACPDRYAALKTPLSPWQRGGRHIVLAAPSQTYARFHECEGWLPSTLKQLALSTDRQIVVRDKESKRSLQADLEGAHALVTHGSIAAVEAAILGTPVFVHPSSAAALVGHVDLARIEDPAYPDREAWVRSLACCQFNERELVDGTLWRLME